MVREIPDARRVDIPGTNHYSLLFKPSQLRDEALTSFLKE
jgi:hypothetical protein